MTTRFKILIVASVTLASVARGGDVAVRTVSGESLVLREFRAVYFPELPSERAIDTRNDSEGNSRNQMLEWPKGVVAKDTIPLKVGHGFGFDFQCPRFADRDELVLDVKLQLPPTNRVVATQYHYDARQSGQPGFIIWEFRKDHPEYHVLGTWRIQVFNQGKEVFSHRFHVVKDQPAKNPVK